MAPRSQAEPGAFYAIGAVARLTGVPEMTLRNWEKRYGVPRPARRTGGGRRLYSGADIALVQHLADAIAQGLPIRKAVAAAHALQQQPEHLSGALLHAALQLDVAGVQRHLDAATATLAPTQAWSRIVAPVLRHLGERWAAGEETIAAEHLLSSTTLLWLRGLMGDSRPPQRPRVVIACGPGEQHELGTVALAACTSVRGTPALYLGANTPCSALDDLQRHMSLRVLCLTATLPATADRVIEALERLATSTCAAETRLAFGGPAFDQNGDARERLARHAVYLGATLDDAVAGLERLATP